MRYKFIAPLLALLVLFVGGILYAEYKFNRIPANDFNVWPFLDLENKHRSEERDRKIEGFLNKYKFDGTWIDCRRNIQELSECIVFLNMLQEGWMGVSGI